MNIIAFAGKKNSGKSTLCNFLHGYLLKTYDLIDAFDITESGDLVISTDVIDDNGMVSKGKGLIDVRRIDIDFALWASSTMWPTVKHYAFATPFKEMAVELFDLKREDVYGSNEKKKTLTPYKWEDMPFKTKKTGYMSVREFLQALGTEIGKAIKNDVWVQRTMKDIEAENPLNAIISDLRHVEEFEAVKEKNGKVIFLTGGEDGDSHSSENEFEQIKFDAKLDTKNQTVDECCHQLIDLLTQWDMLPKEVIVKTSSKEKPDRGVKKIK